MRADLLHRGLTAARADCMASGLEASLTPRELAQLDRKQVPKDLRPKSAAAGTVCARAALAGG
jgi:hypothetical protein